MRHPEDDTLWAYLDGQLAAREHAILSKRLLDDKSLRERLQELRSMDEVLRAAMPPIDMGDAPRRIADRVSRIIQDQKTDPDTQP